MCKMALHGSVMCRWTDRPQARLKTTFKGELRTASMMRDPGQISATRTLATDDGRLTAEAMALQDEVVAAATGVGAEIQSLSVADSPVRSVSDIIRDLRTRLETAPREEAGGPKARPKSRSKAARLAVPMLAITVAMTGIVLRMMAPVDQIILRGPSSIIQSSEPLARCQSIERRLLLVGLAKDSQVIVVNAADRSKCRVIAMDLDEAHERAAAAEVFNHEGLQVEPSGRLEVSVVGRD